MKSSWISSAWVPVLLLCGSMVLAQDEDRSLDAIKAKAEELAEAYRLGEGLEKAIRLLRALQPGAVHDHLKQSDLPDALKDLLRGWAFHQQGDYVSASEYFHRVDPEELGDDPYFSNRLEELMKTADELKGFSVIETENFSIRYRDGKDRVMLLFLPEIMERIYAKYARLFRYNREEKIIVELMPDHSLFSYASALSKSQIETTGTIALCVENRLVVLTPRRVAMGYYWPDVIAHEFIHYILTKQSADHVPLWMQEGVAKYFEARWERDDVNPLDPGLETSLALAIENDSLLSVDDMMPSFAALPTAALARQAYAQTTSMIDYLCRTHGEDILNQLVTGLRENENMDEVLRQTLKRDFESFESGWTEWIQGQGYQVHKETPEMSVSLLDSDQTGEKLLELDEKNQKVKKHTRLGDLLLERRRYGPALREYLKVLEPDQKLDRQVLLRLLECHQHLGSFGEIVGLIDEHVANLETDQTMLIHKARATLAGNQFASARDLLERALRLNPFNPEIYRLLLSFDEAELQGEEREKFREALDLLTHPELIRDKDRKS